MMRKMRKVATMMRIQMNEEPRVKTAAKVFQDMCYSYRDQLSAGIIVAGWDRKQGGQVMSCLLHVRISSTKKK